MLRTRLAEVATRATRLPFPYRDRLAESVRPAVIVSRADFNQRGDLIVATVTTHAPRLPTDVEMTSIRERTVRPVAEPLR